MPSFMSIPVVNVWVAIHNRLGWGTNQAASLAATYPWITLNSSARRIGIQVDHAGGLPPGRPLWAAAHRRPTSPTTCRVPPETALRRRSRSGDRAGERRPEPGPCADAG